MSPHDRAPRPLHVGYLDLPHASKRRRYPTTFRTKGLWNSHRFRARPRTTLRSPPSPADIIQSLNRSIARKCTRPSPLSTEPSGHSTERREHALTLAVNDSKTPSERHQGKYLAQWHVEDNEHAARSAWRREHVPHYSLWAFLVAAFPVLHTSPVAFTTFAQGPQGVHFSRVARASGLEVPTQLLAPSPLRQTSAVESTRFRFWVRGFFGLSCCHFGARTIF